MIEPQTTPLSIAWSAALEAQPKPEGVTEIFALPAKDQEDNVFGVYLCWKAIIGDKAYGLCSTTANEPDEALVRHYLDEVDEAIARVKAEIEVSR